MAKQKRFPNPLKSTPQTTRATHSQAPQAPQVHTSPQVSQAPQASQAPQLPPQSHASSLVPSQVHLTHQVLPRVHTSPQVPLQAHASSQVPTQVHLTSQSLPQAPTSSHSLPQAQNSTHSLFQTHHSEPSPIQSPTNSSPLNGTTPSESLEIPQQSQTSRQYVGRESVEYWTVESIDSQGATKKIKLKYWQVNDLPIGERVIVHFDDRYEAYGEAQGLLAGYCGTLATNSNLFPINFERWSGKLGMPKSYLDNCFETDLKPRFQFNTNEAMAKRYCKLSISKKWAAHRQILWTRFYDPSQSRDEIISNVPERCRKNRENRSKQVIPHTGGSKPLSRKRHEMEQIEVGLTQSNVDESEISPNDVVGRVFGPEHSGRVRSMGMGAAPTNTFRNNGVRLSNLSNSSTSASTSSSNFWHEKYMNLESQVQNNMAAFKAYIMMKEGKIPDQVADILGLSNLKISLILVKSYSCIENMVDEVKYMAADMSKNCSIDIVPSDVASEPNSPLIARGSCGGSNI
ncbi:uncharacterized protein LOC131618935 [Vicia villosa]|uniref:uncharacterized protein LOC131618935 n=1 Tax=Vicia villosa TaxID=3911 RepID=UPI00273C9EFF|nr:uncharacterized protein LOC131618935 [Vicia villosa]